MRAEFRVRIPPLAITGIGLCTPAGTDEPAFARALAAARPVVPADGPPPFRDDPLVSALPAALRRAALCPEPPQPPRRADRMRLPRMVRMALAATREALSAAAPPGDGERIGLAFATGLGPTDAATAFLRGYLVDGPQLASPLLFQHAMPSAAAGVLGIEHQLRGPSVTVHHRDGSPLLALAHAAAWLALGRADAVLVAAVDEVSPASLHAHARFGVLTAGAMRPYDAAADGFVLGEAAAAFVLERADDARARGARTRALLVGVGESGDARPRVGWGRAPAPAAVESVRGLARAVERVDWIAGGGNGTPLDQLEAATLHAAFGPSLPPLSSPLAAIGESFSSAALRLYAAVWALEQQTLLPTIGLAAPSPALPPPLASALVRAPRPAAVERVLGPSLSQGGANVVVALARA
jgi:3-oxoacyl-[acyl-carrier-protein] synthase II